jgi:hypothetical protein
MAGLLMMSAVGRASIGRARSEALLGGLIAALAGAWFVIGPSAWPLFHSGETALRAGPGLIGFSMIVGANIGAGVLLAIFGGMAIAWGLRTERTRAAMVV